MTDQFLSLTQKGSHSCGNLNNVKIEVVPYGAYVTGADIDNFTLVELGFNADGERTCTQLSDKTKQAYLIASPERRYVTGEELVDFYNAIGDQARIVILKPLQTRFDTSAFTLNTGVTAIASGQVAHFDVTTKKFIISDSATPHADYATSSAKFLVVNSEDELEYLCGLPTVRLECITA